MSGIHEEIGKFIPFIDAIQATVGPHCELVLHDFARPEQSLVHIAGNVTDRRIGAPITDFVLARLRKHGDQCENFMNYTTNTQTGKTLRCSTLFIRDAAGKIVGCLCINIDITPMMALKHFVDASLSVDSIPMEENFSNDVCEALNNIIKDTLSHYQIPVANLPKEEKLNIVSHLDEKGAFLVKGAVEQVAATLGVSRYSVYNYLDEVRSHRNGK